MLVVCAAMTWLALAPPNMSAQQPGDLGLGFDLRLFGVDVVLDYILPPLLPPAATHVTAYVGGGWETMRSFRLADGSPVTGLEDVAEAALNDTNGDLMLLLAQGVLPGVPDSAPNLLEIFGGPRVELHSYADKGDRSSYLLQGTAPDVPQALQLSYVVGTALRSLVRERRTLLRRGWEAVGSFEHAPPALNTAADYWRANLTTVTYVPLLDAPSITLYGAQRSVLDLLESSVVPAAARVSIGGIKVRPGLGGAFRGVPASRLDGAFKAVANFDLRLAWHTGLAADVVTPGLVGFVDIGASSDLTSPAQLSNLFTHVLASVGLGVSARVEVLRWLPFDLVAYESYTFVQGGEFAFTVAFGHHF